MKLEWEKNDDPNLLKQTFHSGAAAISVNRARIE